MSDAINPAAPHDLPFFITSPGETDVMMNVMIGVTILIIALIGVFYFRLHALPEHMAHRGQKVQFEIVAVLALLALFTHNHIYWIAGLLLALVELPDFSTPLYRMADALQRIAGFRAPAVEQKPVSALHPEPVAPFTPVRAERDHAEARSERELAELSERKA